MPTVYVFGNPEVTMDALPLRILPILRERRPDTDFRVLDPNEEWPAMEHATVIDTVLGIAAPKIFVDLDSFETAPRLTMHDFDALAQLRLLKKIGRLKSVRIIGLPPEMDEDAAVETVLKMLTV